VPYGTRHLKANAHGAVCRLRGVPAGALSNTSPSNTGAPVFPNCGNCPSKTLDKRLNVSYNAYMDTQTIRVWKSTLKVLRMVRAYTGETMVVILDRVLQAELERVRKEEAEAQRGLARG